MATAFVAQPEVTFHKAWSTRSWLLARGMRLVIRPLLEYLPLNEWTLARLHLFDFAGSVLPLPSGASATRLAHAGSDTELVVGDTVSPDEPGLILYFHGGGFVTCGLRTHRRLVSRISTAAGVPALQVNYRQLPAVTLAQTVSDCVEVYRELLDDGRAPGDIAFAGDSAGGYLAFAVAHRAAAEGLPAPAAIVAQSPWIDLACTHSSGHANSRRDSYIPLRKLVQIAGLLAPADDPLLALHDADLSALPPALIQVGANEVLRSDAELIAGRLGEAGATCSLQIWDRQIHVFQAAADLVPEGRAAIAEIGSFVREQFSANSSHRTLAS